MEETASGVAPTAIEVAGLSPGRRGVHIRQSGASDPEVGFRSADKHIGRGLEHGVRDPPGPQPGDLPNLRADRSGHAATEVFARGFTLGTRGEERILDRDDAAPMID